MKTDIRFKRFIKGDRLQIKIIYFYSNGEKYWFLNRKPHREDGPSYMKGNKARAWYLNNKRFSEKEYLEAVKEYKTTKI